MSVYYILSSSGAGYELDATAEITYKESGKLTSFPVESGESVSDHYTDDPVTFSLRGIITDVKTPSSDNERTRTTDDFIYGVTNLKKNREFFSVHFGTKVGIFNNCLFEDVQISQNKTHGNAGANDSFEINATIRQVRLATRAQLAPFRDPTVQDDYQDKTTGAGSTDEVPAEDTFTWALGLITGS